jgi:hypothetical protein
MTYRGQVQRHGPFADITMAFYMADSGRGGKYICADLDTVPSEVQTTLGNMSASRRK